MSENPTMDPRDVFDQFTGPAAALLEFPRLQKTLQNIKNETNPPIPKTLEQVVAALQGSQYSHLLKDIVYFNGHLAMIWWPDGLEEILDRIHVPEVSMDATFRCVPKVFGKTGQHFTILGLFDRVGTTQKNWLPMISVTMENKMEGLYKAVLDKVWSRLESLRPTSIHCDFERQLISSIECVCEGGEVCGCWFHNVQSVKRKVAAEGLLTECNRNKTVKDWTRSFYSLPLLPPHKIREGWEWVRTEMAATIESLLNPNPSSACAEVLDYWFRCVISYQYLDNFFFGKIFGRYIFFSDIYFNFISNYLDNFFFVRFLAYIFFLR